jgi:deoxyribonuclease IV
VSGKGETHFIGAHTIDNGGIDKAALRAGAAGMQALQIFSAVPKYYGDKSSIRPERVARFHEALSQTPVERRHVVVHAAYVLNLASGEDEKWTRATAGITKELERSNALGAGSVCFHPGAATGGDRAAGIERVALGMIAALESVSGPTRLLVENTAGAGLTVGRTPEEVGAILSSIPSQLRSRVGYGLDSCHLFAAGHDIAQSRERLTAVLDAFEDAAGEPPSFFHLNDSAGELGSNRDRHMLLGEGRIGVEPFRWLLEDPRSRGVPLILETPQQNCAIEPDDLSPDPWDVRMVELLRSI